MKLLGSMKYNRDYCKLILRQHMMCILLQKYKYYSLKDTKHMKFHQYKQALQYHCNLHNNDFGRRIHHLHKINNYYLQVHYKLNKNHHRVHIHWLIRNLDLQFDYNLIGKKQLWNPKQKGINKINMFQKNYMMHSQLDSFNRLCYYLDRQGLQFNYIIRNIGDCIIIIVLCKSNNLNYHKMHIHWGRLHKNFQIDKLVLRYLHNLDNIVWQN